MYANHTKPYINTSILSLSPFPSHGIKAPKCLQDWYRSLARSQNATHCKQKKGKSQNSGPQKWYLGVSTELMYCAVRGIHSDGKGKARPSRDVK